MDSQGYVSTEEVRQALRSVYDADPESNIKTAFLTSLADELKPTDDKGRWTPGPLLVLSALPAFALVVVFVYFSVGSHL